MPEIGEIVAGKYLLEKSIAKGGMGEVFQAVHQEIGKRVALKFLRPDPERSQEVVERFQLEARMAAAAGHHGIIDIYDKGLTESGEHYLVMQFLEGQTLDALLAQKGRVDVERAAYIGCQVLSALQAAHDAGVVHRDLKPANIFLVDTGAAVPAIKLLDFGICRIIDQEQRPEKLTKTGMLVGTPNYMSPEQALGQKTIDNRADIFAMGVILYEMVGGTMPFQAQTVTALMVSIINDDPPRPSSLRPSISHDFDEIILKALHKNRERRFQSAKEMFQDLVRFVDHGSLDHLYLPQGCELPSLPRFNAGVSDGTKDSVEDNFEREVSEGATTPDGVKSPFHSTQKISPKVQKGEEKQGEIIRRRIAWSGLGLALLLLSSLFGYWFFFVEKEDRPNQDQDRLEAGGRQKRLEEKAQMPVSRGSEQRERQEQNNESRSGVKGRGGRQKRLEAGG